MRADHAVQGDPSPRARRARGTLRRVPLEDQRGGPYREHLAGEEHARAAVVGQPHQGLSSRPPRPGGRRG
jgi:hypothetical protein